MALHGPFLCASSIRSPSQEFSSATHRSACVFLFYDQGLAMYFLTFNTVVRALELHRGFPLWHLPLRPAASSAPRQP